MQYMLLIYGNEKRSMTKEEGEREMQAYMAYTDALRKAGVHVSGQPLQPTGTATTISAGKVLDGPFADTKEQLGGYYLIDVPDLDKAIHWAQQCPAAKRDAVEVRPVMTF